MERKNRVYEILARKRPLTIRMIQALNRQFAIPAESLLNQRRPGKAHRPPRRNASA